MNPPSPPPLDPERIVRFFERTRRKNLVDYLDPVAETPHAALERRLRWAAQAVTDPRFHEEALFLLDFAPVLRAHLDGVPLPRPVPRPPPLPAVPRPPPPPAPPRVPLPAVIVVVAFALMMLYRYDARGPSGPMAPVKLPRIVDAPPPDLSGPVELGLPLDPRLQGVWSGTLDGRNIDLTIRAVAGERIELQAIWDQGDLERKVVAVGRWDPRQARFAVRSANGSTWVGDWAEGALSGTAEVDGEALNFSVRRR